MMNFSSSSFPFSVVDVVSGSAILRVVSPSNGAFVAYTVQMGGKSFQTLRAARAYARRLAA